MFLLGNGFLKLRKWIGSLLVMVLSMGYSAGLSLDFQGVYYKPDSEVAYCFYDSTYKVNKTEFIHKTDTYDIKLARNEYEACQIVLRSRFNSTRRTHTVEFSPFVNENGDVLESEVFKENYIVCDTDRYYGKFPDALIPIRGVQTEKFGPANNHPYYIRVHADENTAAGTYTATVTVRNPQKDNAVDMIATLTATVWDFSLPQTPSCETAFGLTEPYIAQAHNVTQDPAKRQALYEEYYECLLQHKMSAYSLPYDILDPRADAYMDDPRCTSFVIPYSMDDDVIRAYYAKLSQNPQWLAKGFFYAVDEPDSLETYEGYNQVAERLARLFPGYNMVTPCNVSFKQDGKTYYNAELQAGKSNILCGISPSFDDKMFQKQVVDRRADGSRIWWYVCCGPNENAYCNVFTYYEGIKARMLLWQQKSLNITGLLYWDTVYWKDVVSPWADPLTTPWTGYNAFGDGALFYNGNTVGIDGPVVSMRLEELTDGIEDYEYLTMAQQLFGDDYMDAKIRKVSAGLRDYTLDDAKLMRVRSQIGADIEKALKK